jgi:MFS family permease
MFKHRYRLVVALLLFFAGMLNYMDRAALSVMAPLVKADLHLNDAQLGFLFSCFFVGYCLFCFISGWGADKFGPRKVYAWAAAIWSVFCGATALVTGFWHLLIVRVLFGIGEGPMGTTTNKSIANWFPRKEIGRAVGFTNAGQPLDAAIAAPVVGLVGLAFGWRIAFVVIALLGLVWVCAWLWLFRDKPEMHNAVSQERRLIRSERPASQPSATDSVPDTHTFWHYILSPAVLGVAAAFFCFNYIQYFFLSWLPSYLTDFQHLDIKSMSIIGILPWLGATLGFLGGGMVCDALYRKSGNFLLSRKLVIFIGLAVAAVAVLATAYPEPGGCGDQHHGSDDLCLYDAAGLLVITTGYCAGRPHWHHRWFCASVGQPGRHHVACGDGPAYSVWRRLSLGVSACQRVGRHRHCRPCDAGASAA